MTRRTFIQAVFLSLFSIFLFASIEPGRAEVKTDAVQAQLYFGLRSADGKGVSEQAWAKFLADVVTPRFPDGLTVLAAYGQGRSGPPPFPMMAETTKLLIIVHPDDEASRQKLNEIKQAYKETFTQDSVFHVEVPARLVD